MALDTDGSAACDFLSVPEKYCVCGGFVRDSGRDSGEGRQAAADTCLHGDGSGGGAADLCLSVF